jgi:8-oxo-dGTP pyrophosphatase MutT (NUDIX family)
MNLPAIREKLAHREKYSLTLDNLTPAGVLMPLFIQDGSLHILFTKRTEKVDHHKGQISFPGGVFQAQDRNVLITALREAEEEIGLKEKDVEVLGELDDTATITQFRITPFVGVFPYPYPFKLNSREVDRLILAPVSLLKDRPNQGPIFEVQEDVIWGATARILKEFLDIIN